MVNLAISVITDEFSSEFDEVCEYIQSQDVKYVELRNVWLGNILDIDERMVNDAFDVLQGCGLSVSALGTPLLKCIPPSLNPNPKKKTSYNDNWQYNFSKFDHALALADKFKTKYIRVFGFNGKFSVPAPEKWGNFPIYTEWSKVLNEWKTKAAQKGKTLICENEGGLCNSLEQIEKIGQDHCNPGFGMLFDTANAVNHNGNKALLTDAWLGRLGKYIKYVHAKGCQKKFLGFNTSYVNGENDICRWPQMVNYFRNRSADAFIGGAPDPLFFSIETHMGKENMLEKSKQSLKNLQAMLK